MDGFGQAGEVLQRIIVLLFALADLAEWAATAPHRVRSRMLAILSIAEPAAQSIAFTTAFRPAGIACRDDSAAAALQLAARLRMLACLLLTLTTLPQHDGRPSGRPPVEAPAMPDRQAAAVCRYHDTS